MFGATATGGGLEGPPVLADLDTGDEVAVVPLPGAPGPGLEGTVLEVAEPPPPVHGPGPALLLLVADVPAGLRAPGLEVDRGGWEQVIVAVAVLAEEGHTLLHAGGAAGHLPARVPHCQEEGEKPGEFDLRNCLSPPNPFVQPNPNFLVTSKLLVTSRLCELFQQVHSLHSPRVAPFLQ